MDQSGEKEYSAPGQESDRKSTSESADHVPKQSSSKDNDTDEIESAFQNISLKDERKGKIGKKSSKEQNPILKDTTVDSIVDYIQRGDCKNIVLMVGAGISTSVGIPDFRSPETGLFHQLEKYDLPYPEAVFDINFFKSNPKPFFHLARELFPGNFNPSPCHYFMKLINDKNLLLRLYTQNIDSLERLAGVPDDKLIEAHGTFNTGHCINKRCRKKYSLEWMKKTVLDKSKEDNVLYCEDCDSLVKPDIIFYGENLPDRFYKLIENDFKKCDLLIIIGTSLTVQPFSSLVELVGPKVPRFMINKTKPNCSVSLIGKLFSQFDNGLAFDSKNNTRDVFMKTDSDSGCFDLAKKLGWDEELQKLINA